MSVADVFEFDFKGTWVRKTSSDEGPMKSHEPSCTVSGLLGTQPGVLRPAEAMGLDASLLVPHRYAVADFSAQAARITTPNWRKWCPGRRVMRCLESSEVLSTWLSNRPSSGTSAWAALSLADTPLANGQRALHHASWHRALPSVTRPLLTAFDEVQSHPDRLREKWLKDFQVEKARKFSTCIKDVCERDGKHPPCIVSKNSGNTAGGQVKQQNVVVWFLCGPKHKKDDSHCERDKDHFHVNFTAEQYPQIEFKCGKNSNCNISLQRRHTKSGRESHFELAERESGENQDCCNSEYVRDDYPLAQSLVSHCLDQLPKPSKPKKG
eukprot:s4351_g3.t2